MQGGIKKSGRRLYASPCAIGIALNRSVATFDNDEASPDPGPDDLNDPSGRLQNQCMISVGASEGADPVWSHAGAERIFGEEAISPDTRGE